MSDKQTDDLRSDRVGDGDLPEDELEQMHRSIVCRLQEMIQGGENFDLELESETAEALMQLAAVQDFVYLDIGRRIDGGELQPSFGQKGAGNTPQWRFCLRRKGRDTDFEDVPIWELYRDQLEFLATRVWECADRFPGDHPFHSYLKGVAAAMYPPLDFAGAGIGDDREAQLERAFKLFKITNNNMMSPAVQAEYKRRGYFADMSYMEYGDVFAPMAFIGVEESGEIAPALAAAIRSIARLHYPEEMLPPWMRDIAAPPPSTWSLREIYSGFVKGIEARMIAYDPEQVDGHTPEHPQVIVQWLNAMEREYQTTYEIARMIAPDLLIEDIEQCQRELFKWIKVYIFMHELHHNIGRTPDGMRSWRALKGHKYLPTGIQEGAASVYGFADLSHLAEDTTDTGVAAMLDGLGIRPASEREQKLVLLAVVIQTISTFAMALRKDTRIGYLFEGVPILSRLKTAGIILLHSADADSLAHMEIGPNFNLGAIIQTLSDMSGKITQIWAAKTDAERENLGVLYADQVDDADIDWLLEVIRVYRFTFESMSADETLTPLEQANLSKALDAISAIHTAAHALPA